MCACWTMHTFSNPRIRFHTTTLISCPTLIFKKEFIFITATAKNSTMQWCDLIKRNVAQFNVESVNYLNIAVHMFSNRPWWFLPSCDQSLIWKLTLNRHKKVCKFLDTSTICLVPAGVRKGKDVREFKFSRSRTMSTWQPFHKFYRRGGESVNLFHLFILFHQWRLRAHHI